MKSTRFLIAAAALGLLAGTPAFAQMQNDTSKGSMSSSGQGMMSSDSNMKMSMKDKKMMTKCQGMSHDMMMKNKSCMKMMKMHPDMMKGG